MRRWLVLLVSWLAGVGTCSIVMRETGPLAEGFGAAEYAACTMYHQPLSMCSPCNAAVHGRFGQPVSRQHELQAHGLLLQAHGGITWAPSFSRHASPRCSTKRL
jgi:hypothetical protein